MCHFLKSEEETVHMISAPQHEVIILRLRTCSPYVNTLQFSSKIYIEFCDTTHENLNPRSRVL